MLPQGIKYSHLVIIMAFVCVIVVLYAALYSPGAGEKTLFSKDHEISNFEDTFPTLSSDRNQKNAVKQYLDSMKYDSKKEMISTTTKKARDPFPATLNANLTGPRICCMIFTTPAEWSNKAQAVRLTWATRCNIALFFYSRTPMYDLEEAIPLAVPEGRAHLTAKTMTALKMSFQKFKSEADWFLKADDDTYIIMENLKSLVSRYEPKNAHYIGGRSMDLLRHGYNGGGAGYLLSNEAVRLITEEGQGKGCKQDGGIEDLDIGDCLQRFEIYPKDTTDHLQRLTFHPDHPYKIFADIGDNKRVYSYRKGKEIFGKPVGGIKTMSPYTISFHYMDPGHMYMYDFLLYELKRGEYPQNAEKSDLQQPPYR